MQSAYHTLRAVAGTLATRLAGHVLEEAYSQDRDEVVFSFSGLSDRLVVSCCPAVLCCYLHSSIARAKRNSADVLSGSLNQTVREVSIHPTDRVMSLHLSGDRTLVIQLFGTRANVVLVSGGGGIVDAFKHSRDLAGQQLAGPPLHAMPSPESLAAAIRNLPLSSLGVAIKKSAPYFPSVIVQEILHRAGLDSETAAAELPADRYAVLAEAMSSVVGDLDHPRPRIYSCADGTPLRFSIIPLSILQGCREDRFDDIHAALRTFIAWKRSAENIADERRLLEHRIYSAIDHARRAVLAIETDLAAGDRAEQYSQYGALVLQHMANIPAGSSSVNLPVPDGMITVPLLPNRTPSQNAQRYFEKAKASKRARQLAEHRRGVYQHRSDHSTALLAELEHISTRQDLKAFMERHHVDLHRQRESGPTDDQDHPLFKTFVVEGGFEVWAGKSSANNDVLTLRHAKPQDFWFHARGVPGSHVILRVATGRGEPGKQAIRQAASIAAYYSKMRTASLVPVAVTRRKYVHKPKGASAGSVVLQREDVIMVEPELPKSAEDNDE